MLLRDLLASFINQILKRKFIIYTCFLRPEIFPKRLGISYQHLECEENERKGKKKENK